MYPELATALHARGWQTVPARGKVCHLTGWPLLGDEEVPLDIIDRIAETAYPDANIALPFGHHCKALAIDIDILDPTGAAELRQLAEDILGETPFVRTGRSPKTALFYKKDPNDKYETLRFHGLEILAGSGTQLVIYGIHPVTNKPYTWATKEPLHNHPDELPTAPLAAVEEFIKQAIPRLQQHNPSVHPHHQGSYIRKITGQKSPLAGLSGWEYGQQILLRLSELQPGNRHSIIKSVIGSLVSRGYPDAKIHAVLEVPYVRRFLGDGTDRYSKITKLIGYYRRRAGGDFTNDLSSTRNYRQANRQGQDPETGPQQHSHLARLGLLQHEWEPIRQRRAEGAPPPVNGHSAGGPVALGARQAP